MEKFGGGRPSCYCPRRRPMRVGEAGRCGLTGGLVRLLRCVADVVRTAAEAVMIQLAGLLRMGV